MITFVLASLLSISTTPYHLDHPVAITGPQHILLGQKMDLNTADAPALEALPGIGPALAQRIVQDRMRRGPFPTVDDLDRVAGIAEKLLNRVRPYLHVTSK